jgi:hypothetical protein
MLGLQPRYYLRQNIAFYLRYQVNLEDEEDHALCSWRHAVFFGVDLDF